jgi:uncharacterized Zn-finger protein
MMTNARAISLIRLLGHNLNHHLNDEAPYRCNLCPSASDNKGVIVRHMKTHNGDRPFECRDCHLAFTTNDNCERHLRNGHGKTSRDAIRASIIYRQQQQHNDESSGNEQGDDGLLDLSADAPATVNIP